PEKILFSLGKTAWILVPTGQLNWAALVPLIERIKYWTGRAPAICERSPDLESGLSPSQLSELNERKPVIIHWPLERYLVRKIGRREHPARTHRINDARQCMIHQGLLHLGYLVGPYMPSANATEALSRGSSALVLDAWPLRAQPRTSVDAREDYLARQ